MGKSEPSTETTAISPCWLARTNSAFAEISARPTSATTGASRALVRRLEPDAIAHVVRSVSDPTPRADERGERRAAV